MLVGKIACGWRKSLHRILVSLLDDIEKNEKVWKEVIKM